MYTPRRVLLSVASRNEIPNTLAAIGQTNGELHPIVHHYSSNFLTFAPQNCNFCMFQEI